MSQVTPPGYLSRLDSWGYESLQSPVTQTAPLRSSFPSWDAVFDLANRVKYYALAAIGLFVLYKLSANPKSPPSSGTASITTPSLPIFTSDVTPIQSTVSINRHNATAFVGRDQSYGFGKKLQLPNGDFLKIDPNDLMYSVEIITTLPNGNLKVKYKVLPSSLFSQARNGDTISYSKIKSYRLHLDPDLCPTYETSSDTCVKSVEAIDVNPKQGLLSRCENTACVGNDKSYESGRKFQLLNGEFLKIDYEDLMPVEIFTFLPNGSQQLDYKKMPSWLLSTLQKGEKVYSQNQELKYKVKHKELPSSLFSQARKDDTIFYREIKSYKLHLAPCPTPQPDKDFKFLDGIERMYPEIKKEHHSFDECEKIVKESANWPGIDFYARKDVPENYHVIAFGDQNLAQSRAYNFADFRTLTLREYDRIYDGEKRLINVRHKTPNYDTPTMRMFRSCPPALEGGLSISRGNEAYTLSPDTKRIYLDQIGVSPCNLAEVEVQSQAHPAKYVSSLHETQCTLTIEAPGKPELEILLDDRRLFVTLKRNRNSKLDYQEFLCESFKNETKAIDESKISALLCNNGILTITIPFISTDGNAEKENTLYES
jgi:HSP20 family molecular chaperone IbpA